MRIVYFSIVLEIYLLISCSEGGCRVQVQKETPDGMVDGVSGYCEKAYQT